MPVDGCSSRNDQQEGRVVVARSAETCYFFSPAVVRVCLHCSSLKISKTSHGNVGPAGGIEFRLMHKEQISMHGRELVFIRELQSAKVNRQRHSDYRGACRRIYIYIYIYN